MPLHSVMPAPCFTHKQQILWFFKNAPIYDKLLIDLSVYSMIRKLNKEF